MQTINPTNLRQLANSMLDTAAKLEELANELDRDTAGNLAGLDTEPLAAGESTSVAGTEPSSRGATDPATNNGKDLIGEAIAEAIRTDQPVFVPKETTPPVIEFGPIGPCPNRDDAPHDFQPMRERDGIYIEKCMSCNAPRWCPIDSPHPRVFNYGPPPPPKRMRMMGIGEELEPGETFERVDTDVPRVISTPQPEFNRIVGGRRVEPDLS